MLLGGAGAAALITMPDVFASAKTLSGTANSAGAAATQGHFFLYGVNPAEAAHTARVQAARSPVARAASLPAPASVTTELAATPVLSPDAGLLALAEVATAAGGATVTVTVVSKASGAVARTARLAMPDVPADAVVLVTPAFSPSATTLAIVLAISVPSGPRMVRKADPRTGGFLSVPSATWRSHHALAYLDLRSGALAGPFRAEGGPSLALSTAVATDSELFLWTTADPQAVAPRKGQSAPLPWVAAFAFGAAKARFSVPSSAPWPGGEPAAALASGDAARFVNGRTLQVAARRDGHLTESAITPLSSTLAKPSAVTMSARPDGSLFLAKPGIGRAVVIDQAQPHRVRHDITFAVPDHPHGAPWSKAILSPDGALLYAVGGASAGGLSAYDVATGNLVATYSNGSHYSGVYQLPSGTLLAVSAANPRLSYFSPELTLLGTTETALQISAVF